MRSRTRSALLAALLAAAAGCADQGDLFGPSGGRTEEAVRLLIGEGPYTFYEGDRVAVGTAEAVRPGMKVEVLVVDSFNTVLWRSAPAPMTAEGSEIVLDGLPSSLLGQPGLKVTGSLVDAQGVRTFASDDSIPAASLSGAAKRPARFWAGRSVAGESGVPQEFVTDVERGRLFFASAERSAIGMVDLGSGVASLNRLEVSSGPVSMSIGAGRLGALVDGGTRLVLWNLVSLARESERVLPPAKVHMAWPEGQPDSLGNYKWVQRTFGVRPYASDVVLSCADLSCQSPMAYLPSGAFGEGAGPGVLRRVALSGSRLSPVVAPLFHYNAPVDTIPVQVYTIVPDAFGGDSVAALNEYGNRCLTTALGAGIVATAARPGSPLYVADDDPKELCGGGTRLIRIDRAQTDRPQLSEMGQWNLHGEDRIDAIREIEVSPGGEWVLIRGDGWVYLLDADLRLKGRVPEQEPTAIAWVEGGVGEARFGVAGKEGVTVYEAARLTKVAHVATGPVREGRLVLVRGAGHVVVASAPKERPGIVLARTHAF